MGCGSSMESNQSNTNSTGPTSASDVPHTITARYEIGDVLGEGGSAVVKGATSKVDGAKVAMKIVHRTKLSLDEELSLRQEAEMLQQFAHPNIVKAYDFFEEKKEFYIVLELVDGGELFDRIVKKTRFTEKEARDLVLIVLNAIKYMHDSDIVHRDLKPENLLMESRNDDAHVKIADFGFAVRAKGFTVTTICGTPCYVAPEVIAHKPYGKPVDMWSFGVILFILLGGYPPFNEENEQVMFHKILNAQFTFHPERWDGISDEAKDLIRGLLTLNPHKRLTVDQALEHAWMQEGDAELDEHNLDANLEELRKWQASKRLKAGVKAVMAFNKLKKGASKLGGKSANRLHSANTLNSLPHEVKARYTFGDKLGEGGYGVVVQASSVTDAAQVAIKCVKREKLSERDEVSLRQEAEMLQTLRHPNIVQAYDFFEEPDTFYVVMELIKGGELFDRIVKKTYYNEKEARDLVYILLTALKYMHDKDIVHRDLKPENILMTDKDDDADVKIVDFGFAVQAKGFTITNQCGTPGYIAPEIIERKPYGKPVDMWSFGVILYILLGGYPPFHDDNQKNLFRKIVNGKYEFHEKYWGGVSEEAKSMIRGLLTVNPHRRLTVDQALQHPWMDQSEDSLETHNLDSNLAELKNYQATKKLKAGVKAVIAMNKMKKLMGGIASAKKQLDLPHTVVARYKMGDKLGEGGYAVVNAATSNIDGSEVAIKCVKREKLSQADELSLRQEAEMLQTLRHPNIVQAYDLFEEPDMFYVVLELIAGGELFDRIVKKTYYNEKEARDLVYIVLNALKYMHDMNIIHRDLKPENLLLTSKEDDADVKIADFGFAVQAKGFTVTNQCGTPGYMAPEIIENKPYGKPVDMWSFGVILYILLGGYPPFHDDNQKNLFRKIVNGRYEFHEEYWGGVSEEAKSMIRGLLTVNPHKRLTVDQALQHPWMDKTAEDLENRNLDSNLAQLKNYQATKKLKAGVKAIMAINKMKKLMGAVGQMKLDAVSGAEKAAAAGTAAVPQTVHTRYTMGKKLGEGGYAVVNAATNKLDGSEVAIKIVKRKSLSKEDEAALRVEVQIMQELVHPNIVQAYEFYEEAEHIYIVLELIAGGELFDRIVQKTYYNEKEARDLVDVLLNAIKFCHDANVVHRDLKPENLLLTSASDDADVKLADFGFAVRASGSTIKQQCGTPGYMAPEIILNKAYGKGVDMWAFGVILYILLGGYPPFHDDNQNKLFRKIVNGQYEFHPQYWGTVSDEAKDMIRGLLTVNPRHRLTVDQALVHPWMNRAAEELSAQNLDSNLKELKKFQAGKKLRGAVKAIIAVNKIKRLTGAITSAAKASAAAAAAEEDEADKFTKVGI